METQALVSNSKTCQSLHVVGSQQPVDQLMMSPKESEANEIGVRLKIRLELGWHLFKVGGDGGACEHSRDTSFDRLCCQAASRLKGDGGQWSSRRWGDTGSRKQKS